MGTKNLQQNLSLFLFSQKLCKIKTRKKRSLTVWKRLIWFYNFQTDWLKSLSYKKKYVGINANLFWSYPSSINKHPEQVSLAMREKREVIVLWKSTPLKKKPVANQITNVHFFKQAKKTSKIPATFYLYCSNIFNNYSSRRYFWNTNVLTTTETFNFLREIFLEDAPFGNNRRI